MSEGVISKRSFFILLSLSLCIVGGIFLYSKIDHRTKVVMCNTGSKISVYIRVKNSIDVVLNPENKQTFLQCISSVMPFYDRHIEMVILNEETKDIPLILQRFTIGKLISPLKNNGNFVKNNKITSVINSKDIDSLRIGSSIRIRMYKGPITSIRSLQIYGISYWEGKSNLLILEKVTSSSYFKNQFFDYVIVQKPLKATDLLFLDSLVQTVNIVSIKNFSDQGIYSKILQRFSSNITFKFLEKYERYIMEI